jgi:hypothetical protein
MIMRKIIICLALPYLLLSCSVGPGYKWATDEEQVTLASTVIWGVVDSVVETLPNNKAVITMERYQVWKSSHLRKRRRGRRTKIKLEISGFRSTAACGAGMPSEGEELILFLCPNRDSKTWLNPSNPFWRKKYWKLNDIAVFTGMIRAKRSSKRYRKVKRLARKLGWRTQRFKCGKRDDSPVRDPFDFDFPPNIEGPTISADDIDFPEDPDGP